MSEPRIRSVSIELESDHGGSTVVVRNPDSPTQRVFVAGPATGAEVNAALARLGLGAPASLRPAAPLATAPPPSVRLSATPPPVNVSTPPPEAVAGRLESLADRLHALNSAVLRVGSLTLTESVDEAIDAIAELVVAQELSAVARLLTRLDVALGDERAGDETALLLGAIAEVVDVLESGEPPAVFAELGQRASEDVPIGATELVDVGRHRERMHFTTETRLLVELATGILYREHGLPAQLSYGPSGRKLMVDLGSREESGAPERLRIFQYEFRPAASGEELERALGFAEKSLALPRDIRERPLLLAALPRAVFLAPATITVGKGGSITLTDEDGESLSVARGAPGEALLELLSASEEPAALSGALVLGPEGIALSPWAAVLRDPCRVAQLSL